jgi:AcrR family transcriptional regulator
VNSKPNIQHSHPDSLPTRITAAARGRFQRFGYAKTSMQEIALACQMSAANLYRFYPGKLAIAAAVMAAEQQTLLAACDKAVASARGTPADRLIALFLANIDATRRRIKQAPLLFDLGLKVAREDAAVRQQFLDEVETRILAILLSGRDCSATEFNALKTHTRLILIASAPFVLPWMMLNEPFGNPRAQVEPLVRALVSGLAVDNVATEAAPRFS